MLPGLNGTSLPRDLEAQLGLGSPWGSLRSHGCARCQLSAPESPKGLFKVSSKACSSDPQLGVIWQCLKMFLWGCATGRCY